MALKQSDWSVSRSPHEPLQLVRARPMEGSVEEEDESDSIDDGVGDQLCQGPQERWWRGMQTQEEIRDDEVTKL